MDLPALPAPRSGTSIRTLRLLGLLLLGASLFGAGSIAAEESRYLGAAACGDCHPKELALWKGSHHDLAMTEPSEQTVLGDFNDAKLKAHGATSRFFRRDGAYMVRTDGPDGSLQDYPVRYTFGLYPLQQYLIELPRRTAPGPGSGLGCPAQGVRRAALVPSLPERTDGPHQSAALDSPGPDLELSVRGLPFHGRRKGLRPGARDLRDPLRRDRRGLRVLSRPRLPPWRLGPGGQSGGGQGRNAARGPQPGTPGRPSGPGWGSVAEGSRHGQADPQRPAHLPGPNRAVRPLPFPARPHLGGPAPGRGAEPGVPARPAGAGAVFCGRPDQGRGLRARLLPAEPHVSPGRGLLRLPRPSQPRTQGSGQCPVPALSSGGTLRRSDPSSPCAGRRRVCLRRLSHAPAALHGGARTLRS